MIVSYWLSDENDACKNDIYPYLCIRNRMNDNSNQT